MRTLPAPWARSCPHSSQRRWVNVCEAKPNGFLTPRAVKVHLLGVVRYTGVGKPLCAGPLKQTTELCRFCAAGAADVMTTAARATSAPATANLFIQNSDLPETAREP